MNGRRSNVSRVRKAFASLPLLFGLTVLASCDPAPKCFGATATIVGTAAGETLTGKPGPDVIVGLGGDDTIRGLGDNDLLCGGDGSDTLYGDAGADKLDGGLGFSDNLLGGQGADQLQGGGGDYDIALFSDLTGAVDASLTRATAVSGGTSDELSHINGLVGTVQSDVLAGDGAANILAGLQGSDALTGAGGIDVAAFLTSGVTANLQSRTASGEGTDQLNGIEGLAASDFAATFVGDSGANIFLGGRQADTVRGGGGDDHLVGAGGDDRLFGEAGADTMEGGPGGDAMDGGTEPDVVSFDDAAQGVVVNLTSGGATGDGSDTLTNTERVVGSAFNDTLSADGAANVVWGGPGDDSLSGVGGDDALDGGGGSDAVAGGPGRDFCAGEQLSACEVTLQQQPARPATATSLDSAAVVESMQAQASGRRPGRPPNAANSPASAAEVGDLQAPLYSQGPLCFHVQGADGSTYVYPPQTPYTLVFNNGTTWQGHLWGWDGGAQAWTLVYSTPLLHSSSVQPYGETQYWYDDNGTVQYNFSVDVVPGFYYRWSGYTSGAAGAYNDWIEPHTQYFGSTGLYYNECNF